MGGAATRRPFFFLILSYLIIPYLVISFPIPASRSKNMQTIPTSGLPPSAIAPPIIVSSRDFNRLEQLLDSPALRRHPAAVALTEELNRAEVVPPEKIPAGVVTMHSTVECEDEITSDRHTLTLVYPNEANVGTGHVSILARSAAPCSAFPWARASTGPRPMAANCACA
jgi:hypothetical protein